MNERFDKFKPWELAKTDDAVSRRVLHEVCSDAIAAFKVLTYYLAPILPQTAARVLTWLGSAGKTAWTDSRLAVAHVPNTST